MLSARFANPVIAARPAASPVVSSFRVVSVSVQASKKLFVGNLSWETSQDDLRQYFSQWGEVEDIFLPTDKFSGRPRGFGFVTMEEASADTAVVSANAVEYQGRALTVNEAESKEASDERRAARFNSNEDGTPSSSKNIYVANLALEATEADLTDFFSAYGTVEKVALPMDRETGKPRGFGFVEMPAEEADQAVAQANEVEFMGRNLSVSISTGSGPGGRGGGRGGRGGGRGYGGRGGGRGGGRRY